MPSLPYVFISCHNMAALFGVFYGFILIIVLFTLRLFFVVRKGSRYRPGKKGSVSVLVVAGSGGHTTEILRLMGSLSESYCPRHYVIADTDKMSEDKIRTLEASKKQRDQGNFTIHRVPRSREVRQSWISSVFTTINAFLYSVPLLFNLQPDVVLCNGPGTCVPLCLAGLLPGILGTRKILIVYVESICRVERLSLSGKILYRLSDYFFVQWPNLKEKYPKSIYLGRVV